MTQDKAETPYRVIMPKELCSIGVTAKTMLDEHGNEPILHSREAVDTFEAERGVAATPQFFIDGGRIGGSDYLERCLSA